MVEIRTKDVSASLVNRLEGKAGAAVTHVAAQPIASDDLPALTRLGAEIASLLASSGSEVLIALSTKDTGLAGMVSKQTLTDLQAELTSLVGKSALSSLLREVDGYNAGSQTVLEPFKQFLDRDSRVNRNGVTFGLNDAGAVTDIKWSIDVTPDKNAPFPAFRLFPPTDATELAQCHARCSLANLLVAAPLSKTPEYDFPGAPPFNALMEKFARAGGGISSQAALDAALQNLADFKSLVGTDRFTNMPDLQKAISDGETVLRFKAQQNIDRIKGENGMLVDVFTAFDTFDKSVAGALTGLQLTAEAFAPEKEQTGFFNPNAPRRPTLDDATAAKVLDELRKPLEGLLSTLTASRSHPSRPEEKTTLWEGAPKTYWDNDKKIEPLLQQLRDLAGLTMTFEQARPGGWGTETITLTGDDVQKRVGEGLAAAASLVGMIGRPPGYGGERIHRGT